MKDLKDLKDKTIRGGLARMVAQGISFGFRLGSVMVLARLLSPEDFGLVGMVTALTGTLSLFRDFGLSTASVQHETVTEEQISTLFWINIAVGALLAALASALAPMVAAFYHDSRLVGVTVVLAFGFLFNAAGVQHGARLQRELRFTATAVVGLVALFVSTGIGVVMAARGYGYWALVGMTVTGPLINTIALWATANWIPGLPCRNVGIRSMMRYGGTVTINGLVTYVAYNLEKVLLGRYWGAEVVGLYGRAYQLINIPTENLNSAVGEVAFSALARIQRDPGRVRSYFLKGYALVIGLTLPITLACALFADDLILVLLGPTWKHAGAIFSLLAPTILVFALINPLAWLLFSLGMVARSLRIALVIAPVVITGYVIGLPYGPKGVALGYSGAMLLWVIPHIVWCVRGTGITVRDIWITVRRPLISGLVAAALTVSAQAAYGPFLPPLARLVVGAALLAGGYLGMLLYVMGQGSFYWKLLQVVTKTRAEAGASA
jgi:PST family polysaccharide transporter